VADFAVPTEDRRLVLPVKKPVRLAEGLDFGDEIAGELELL
jgi:hypothetical protein